MKKSIADWRIFEFLKEDNGHFSSTRLFALFIIITAVMDWQHAIWIGNGIWQPTYQTVGLIAGVLGFKVLQKNSEQKVNTQTSETISLNNQSDITYESTKDVTKAG